MTRFDKILSDLSLFERRKGNPGGCVFALGGLADVADAAVAVAAGPAEAGSRFMGQSRARTGSRRWRQTIRAPVRTDLEIKFPI